MILASQRDLAQGLDRRTIGLVPKHDDGSSLSRIELKHRCIATHEPVFPSREYAGKTIPTEAQLMTERHRASEVGLIGIQVRAKVNHHVMKIGVNTAGARSRFGDAPVRNRPEEDIK